jgi:hypothetical protein
MATLADTTARSPTDRVERVKVSEDAILSILRSWQRRQGRGCPLAAILSGQLPERAKRSPASTAETSTVAEPWGNWPAADGRLMRLVAKWRSPGGLARLPRRLPGRVPASSRSPDRTRRTDVASALCS